MEMNLVSKQRLFFNWPSNCGDFFRRELVKLILTFLKRNISPLKLPTNINAHAQIYFTAKSSIISPNGNPPLLDQSKGISISADNPDLITLIK